jgi:multidrug resistance efflux pump
VTGSSDFRVVGSVDAELVTVSLPDISGDHQQVLKSHPQGRVEAGDVIASLDSRLLSAKAKLAKANVDLATAQTALPGQKKLVPPPAKAQPKPTGNKAKVQATINSLKAKASRVKRQLSDVKQTISQLQQALKSTQLTLKVLPHIAQQVDFRLELQAKVKKLNSQIKAFQKIRSQQDSSLQKINASLAKANGELAKLNKPPAQQPSPSPSPSASPEPASTSSSSAEASAIAALTQANSELDAAEVTAPVTGQLVRVADPGQVLPAGSRVALIRPDTKTLTAWVTPEVRAQLCLGDQVTISAGWLPEAITGSLTDLGDEAHYPPTSVTSQDTHQLRGFQLSIQAEQTLPAGLAVDIDLPQESKCNG